MSDLEPTMADVRAQFPDRRDQAWFDRALTAHDAKQRRAVLRETADDRHFWGPHGEDDESPTQRYLRDLADTPAGSMRSRT